MPHVLTLVAAREAMVLTQAAIGRVRDALPGSRTPVVLSPGEAVDIPLQEPPDLDRARIALEGAPADVLATRMDRRRRALLVADMDGTIVTGETLDELSAYAGVGEQVSAITQRSMNGEADFAGALRERVALLAGLDLRAIEAAWRQVRLTSGAATLVATMRAHGAKAALVSGSFTVFTRRAAALCGFDSHEGNILLDDGTALTGRVAEPILDRAAKAALLRRLASAHCLGREQTLAVGDGANDLEMLRAAGLGVAFHATPIVRDAAANRVDHCDLRALLFAQGYPAAVFHGD